MIRSFTPCTKDVYIVQKEVEKSPGKGQNRKTVAYISIMTGRLVSVGDEMYVGRCAPSVLTSSKCVPFKGML